MKLFKRIIQFFILIILVGIAYLCGCYAEELKQKQQESKSTVTTIAVVNADNGVFIDGKKTNYADELMTFPDVNFKITGLEDARDGLSSEKYAAYILIPEAFSQSIDSINGEPEKVQVSYEINSNLREDVQIKVVNDIHNFMLNLSTNISYVYVDAILREVHSVQDDSLSIMANDISDKEAIDAIDTDALIEDVEYEALETGTIEIGYMDLSDDFKKVNDLSDNIYTTYETDMQAAEDALTVLADTGTIDSAVLNADTVLENVDILTDSEGNQVCNAGMEKLHTYSEDYKQRTINKKEAAKETLGWKKPDEQQETAIDKLKGQIDAQISLLEAFVNQRSIAVQTVSGNAPDGGDTASLQEIDKVIVNLRTLKNNLDTYYTNGVNAIDAIPDASWMPDEVQTIINEEIQQKLTEECIAEAEIVSAALAGVQTQVDGYAKTLGEFDALSYIEKEKIATDMTSMQQVLLDMQTEIITTDNTYIQYIHELNLITSQNITDLQESLNTSYEQTQANIDTTVTALKTNRENLNAQNIEFLKDITLKLPYTRLGDLEYTQVYDFIVQPVVEKNLSEKGTIVFKSNAEREKEILFSLIIGMTALTGIYWSVLVIHKRYQKSNTGKEEEEWLMD